VQTSSGNLLKMTSTVKTGKFVFLQVTAFLIERSMVGHLVVYMIKLWPNGESDQDEGWPASRSHCSLLSSRQHLSNDDCLENKREDCQNCSMLSCVIQLCTVTCTHA